MTNSLTHSYQVKTLSESASPATSKTTCVIPSVSNPKQLPHGNNIRTRQLSWKMTNGLWEWPSYVSIRMIVQSGSRTSCRLRSDKKSNRTSIEIWLRKRRAMMSSTKTSLRRWKRAKSIRSSVSWWTLTWNSLTLSPANRGRTIIAQRWIQLMSITTYLLPTTCVWTRNASRIRPLSSK